jgi:hypothetical protein
VEVIERLEGHYWAREVPFGVVYRWCPECVVAKCACGKRSIHKSANSVGSSTVVVCECGEDYTTEDQEEVEGVGHYMQPDKALHPWHYAGDREGFGLPY